MSMSLVFKTESLYIALELAMWTRAGLELTDIHLPLSLCWGGVESKVYHHAQNVLVL